MTTTTHGGNICRGLKQATMNLKFIQSNMEEGIGISIFADKGGLTVKSGNNSMNGVRLSGITYGHSEVYDMPIAEGRYFTMQEVKSGRNVVLIGSNVAEALFPNGSAPGQQY